MSKKNYTRLIQSLDQAHIEYKQNMKKIRKNNSPAKARELLSEQINTLYLRQSNFCNILRKEKERYRK